MHNPESVLENEMHKVPWDFEIQTDYLISARRPDLVIVPWDFEIQTDYLISARRPDLVMVKKIGEPAKSWILPSRQTTE